MCAAPIKYAPRSQCQALRMLGKIAAAPANTPSAITTVATSGFSFPAAFTAIMLGPAVAIPISSARSAAIRIDPRKINGSVISCTPCSLVGSDVRKRLKPLARRKTSGAAANTKRFTSYFESIGLRVADAKSSVDSVAATPSERWGSGVSADGGRSRTIFDMIWGMTDIA